MIFLGHRSALIYTKPFHIFFRFWDGKPARETFDFFQIEDLAANITQTPSTNFRFWDGKPSCETYDFFQIEELAANITQTPSTIRVRLKDMIFGSSSRFMKVWVGS